MNRILKFHVDEIVLDPEEASKTLNAACKHARKMKLTGCCQADSTIIVSFEETAAPTRFQHLFAPFADSSENGVIDEINSRYTYGFTAVASFRAGESVWGLFSFDPAATSVHSGD